MAPPIQLYYDFLSQPSRTLYIFLNMNNIPFQKCPISIADGEQLGEDYRRVNRFRKLPCIVDADGFQLAETTAILQYLVASARQHGREIADHWYPEDVQQRSRVNEYLSWQHVNTRNTCTTYFRLCWMMPHLKGVTSSAKRLQEAKNLMLQAIDVIETVWLAGGEKQQWLVGTERITIADLLAASELEQLKLTDHDVYEGRPNITRWMANVRRATQPHYDDAHAVISRVSEMGFEALEAYLASKL